MVGYRLYFLDREGRIQAARELDCDGDDLAIARAEQEADGRPMELWQRARVVKRFEARPTEA